MPFWDGDERLESAGRELVNGILARNRGQGLGPDDLAVTWVLYDAARLEAGQPPCGYSYRGDLPFYPCSVVKCFWLAACHARLEEGFIQPHAELERALHDMIVWSSNTATNYVIDLVTGTTGDTLLDECAFAEWAEKRNWANRYFQSFGWPEMTGINVCQKNMDDDRYGRERQFVGEGGRNHNSLTPNATARLYHEIFHGRTFPEARQRMMRDLLARRHDREWVEANPNAQVKGYFGAGVPPEAKLWSKAGWTGWTGDAAASYRRHDSAYIAVPELPPFILVVATRGKAMSADERCLPDAARSAIEILGSIYR